VDIYLLENHAVTILALLFTVTYVIGSRLNYKIQKKVWKTLSKEMKLYCKEAAFKGLGSSGFKIGCRPKTGPLAKLEVSIALLPREISLYFLFSKYKGKRDNIVLKSNFRTTPNLTLEIIKRGSKFHKELLKNPTLEELQHEKLSEYFFLASSNSNIAMEFLTNKGVTLGFARLSSYLERLSITKEEPNLLLSCTMDENAIRQLLNIASICGEAAELGFK